MYGGGQIGGEAYVSAAMPFSVCSMTGGVHTGGVAYTSFSAACSMTGGVHTGGVAYTSFSVDFSMTGGVQMGGVAVIPTVSYYNFSGPTSSYVAMTSSAFTVSLSGLISGTLTVTPSASNGDGVFSPTAVSLSNGNPTSTFTYTPSLAGVRTLGVTNDSNFVDPSSISFVSTIASGYVNPQITSTQGPSMGGWNTSNLSSLNGWWGEWCRDISGDNVSPYNAALQTLFTTLGTGDIQWEFGKYGYGFNIVPDTTTFSNLGTMAYGTSPSGLTSAPFAADQAVENWPLSFTNVTLTNGSSIVTGSHFMTAYNGSSVLSWPAVAGGSYVINNSYPFLYIDSVQSDTQLTLTAPFTGTSTTTARMTGPFNISYPGGVSGDHHQYVLMISSSTGLPYKLYEGYNVASTDGGNTWSGSGVGYWDLTGTLEQEDFVGASSAAGTPYFPFSPTYDEILQGAILHAIPMTVGGGAGWGLGAAGFVFPAKQSNSGSAPIYPGSGLPLGARVRLKSDFDISAYSPTNQIILTAAKRFGFINTDWTSPDSVVQMIGTYDARWNNNDIFNGSYGLWGSIPATNLELIDTIAPRFSISGPSTATHGTLCSFVLTQYPFVIGKDNNYSCNLYPRWQYSSDGTTWSGGGWLTPLPTATPSNPGPFTVTFTPENAGMYEVNLTYGGNNWLAPPFFQFTVT